MAPPESNEKKSFRRRFGIGSDGTRNSGAIATGHSRWTLGILNDPETIEVPGSVILLADRNEPLGMRDYQPRTSHSSLPIGYPLPEGVSTPNLARPEPAHLPEPEADEQKRTADGAIILNPQPEESANDPLNWPDWRRNLALLCLGFYCMVGGGVTPLIAAGFTDVAAEFNVHKETVALTTGLYMMGMGLGSVFASPTAILFGKRPVYLASALLFIATSLWAGWSPSFESLLAARVFQGFAISPIECLPSATIAEIFFLHERAYRIGIYTLLLLGGKNLVPLVSAVVIGSLGWRWTFWIVAMIGGLCVGLLFFFVPETFWDRTPHRATTKRPSFLRRLSSRHGAISTKAPSIVNAGGVLEELPSPVSPGRTKERRHVGFAADGDEADDRGVSRPVTQASEHQHDGRHAASRDQDHSAHGALSSNPVNTGDPEKRALADTEARATGSAEAGHAATHDSSIDTVVSPAIHSPEDGAAAERGDVYAASTPGVDDHPDVANPNMRAVNSPYNANSPHGGSSDNVGYFNNGFNLGDEKIPASRLKAPPKVRAYTHNLRQKPPQSFTQQLKPFYGRLNSDNWFKVMARPFILFAYPAVLWSSLIYACSIGWLIVISEVLAILYRDADLYNFTALQTGLVYISPFIGGILGTGVAGKVSDIIVRAMSKRNGGLYEPEFRLAMVIPIALTTTIGLMGFGWSIEERDHWMVPTIFFGIISFGCSLGSTTSITFCVDSYRQYAGEALVTLNFAKNIFHGLAFSLFVTHWLADDGPKMVFVWIGVIQLLLCMLTIPMYIFGKQMRLWTVRRNLMEKL